MIFTTVLLSICIKLLYDDAVVKSHQGHPPARQTDQPLISFDMAGQGRNPERFSLVGNLVPFDIAIIFDDLAKILHAGSFADGCIFPVFK